MPVWGAFLSEPLAIVGLVGRYPANFLMARMPIPRRRSFPAGAMRPPLLCGISTGFPVLSPCGGQVAYALLTRAPVAAMVHAMPLDLHVLSLPLAFILSQDQTLRCLISFSSFSLLAQRGAPYPGRNPDFLDGGPRPLSLPVSSNAFPVALSQCAVPPRTGTDCKLKPFSRNLQAPDRLFSTRGGFFSAGPRRRTPLRRLRLQRYELQSFPSKFFKHFFRENSRHQAQLAA